MTDVVLDIDGVMADFEGAFCKKFGWERRRFEKLEYRYPGMREEIEWFSLFPRTYETLDILDVGVKIARFCKNEGYIIHVVSSRPDTTYKVTCDWLKANKIPFHAISLVNGSKMGTIKRIAPIFVVEDMLRVVEDCADMGIPSFLVDHPWNQKPDLDGCIHRIKDFEEFLGKFTTYFDI